jgi:hypothetical protein
VKFIIKNINAILCYNYCKLCRGFIFMVRLKIRSVETIRNVLILKVIVKVNKEIVQALINC